MAKAELKTRPTDVTVDEFIASLPDECRRDEAKSLDAIYRQVTGLEPKMWGPSIVGYGFTDTNTTVVAKAKYAARASRRARPR